MKRYSIPILVFIGYGAWAYYSNYNSTPIRSAIIHGTGSFFIILVIQYAIATLIDYYKSQENIYLIALLSMLPCWSMNTLLSIIHYVIGTKNIAVTILPTLLLGSVYGIYYGLQLKSTNISSKPQDQNI